MKRLFLCAMAAALALTGCGASAGTAASAVSGTSAAAQQAAAQSTAAAGSTLLDCTGTRDVTISAAGSYTLTGTLTGTVVVEVSKSDDVELILQNLTVTAADGPALWVKKAGSVTVTLPAGTASTLTDSAAYTVQTDEEPNAALFCNADLTITGEGSLTVTGLLDHAVRCKDSLEVAGGSLTLTAVGKGLKAKDTLTVSGGSVTVTDSEEGMEANTLCITGGVSDVTARDDGLNASSPDNWTGDAPNMTVSGGTLLVDAGGDGLDSNGTLTVSGGVVLVSGPTSSGDGALDAESTPVITGGVVLAAGSSGMAVNFGGSSTQASWLASTGSQPAGTSLTLTDDTGAVLAHWTPAKAYQCAVVSTPAMAQGGSYTLLTGAAADAADEHGYAAGGSASGGETAAQTTLTALNQSDIQGMGGGMRGGGMPGTDGARPERIFGENGGKGGKMGLTPPDGAADAAPPQDAPARPDTATGATPPDETTGQSSGTEIRAAL